MEVLCMENGQVKTKDFGDLGGEYSKKHPVVTAAERLADEAKGWRGYKHMGERYEVPSYQEFQHMLLAIDDFFTAVLKDGGMTEKERAEIRQVVQIIHKNYNG